MRLLPSVFVVLCACGDGLTAINDTEAGPFPDPDAHTDELIDTDDHDGTNAAPVADAGEDADAEVGDVVEMDGSGSDDPDGDELTYEWDLLEKPSASGTSIVNERTVDPQFWADVEGTYRLELTVRDGELSGTDDVYVVVSNPNGVPVASAGSDQSVAVGDTVQMNGSSSSDPDGDALNFEWSFVSKPSGSSAGLDNPTNALPRFIADVAGAYELSLVVDDGVSSSAPDRVRVQAASAEDGDCLGCSAEAERRIRLRVQAGDLAGGPALVLPPLLMLLWQRKRGA